MGVQVNEKRSEIKALFQNGDKPSGNDFALIIDSPLTVDSVVLTNNGGLDYQTEATAYVFGTNNERTIVCLNSCMIQMPDPSQLTYLTAGDTLKIIAVNRVILLDTHPSGTYFDRTMQYPAGTYDELDDFPAPQTFTYPFTYFARQSAEFILNNAQDTWLYSGETLRRPAGDNDYATYIGFTNPYWDWNGVSPSEDNTMFKYFLTQNEYVKLFGRDGSKGLFGAIELVDASTYPDTAPYIMGRDYQNAGPIKFKNGVTTVLVTGELGADTYVQLPPDADMEFGVKYKINAYVDQSLGFLYIGAATGQALLLNTASGLSPHLSLPANWEFALYYNVVSTAVILNIEFEKLTNNNIIVTGIATD